MYVFLSMKEASKWNKHIFLFKLTILYGCPKAYGKHKFKFVN